MFVKKKQILSWVSFVGGRTCCLYFAQWSVFPCTCRIGSYRDQKVILEKVKGMEYERIFIYSYHHFKINQIRYTTDVEILAHIYS